MSTETATTSKVDAEGGSRTDSPEDARRELEEQFNLQRARMKELFLQKEEELQQMKEEKEQLQSEILGLRAEVQQLQILSANQQSEMQSLQLLVSGLVHGRMAVTTFEAKTHYIMQYPMCEGGKTRLRRRCTVCKKLTHFYCSGCEKTVCMSSCFPSLHS